MIFKLGEDGKVAAEEILEFEKPKQVYEALERLAGPLPGNGKIKNTDTPSLWIKILFFIAVIITGELLSRANTLLDYIYILAGASIVLGGGITVFGMFHSKFRQYLLQRKRDKKAGKMFNRLLKNQETSPFSLFLRPFYLDGQLYSLRASPPRYTIFLPQPWTSFHRRIETLISMATHTFGEFLAMGTREQRSNRPGMIISQKDWQAEITLLAQKAQMITLIPSIRPGTLWEIDMLKEEGLLDKTVFFMPPYSEVKLTSQVPENLLSLTLEKRLNISPIPVLVHFSFDDGKDEEMASRLEELKNNYEGEINFETINLYSSLRFIKRYKIHETPRIILFYEGRAVQQLEGLQTPESLSQMIEKVLQATPRELAEMSVSLPKESKSKRKPNKPPTWGTAFGSGVILGLIYAVSHVMIENKFFIILLMMVAFYFAIIARKNKFSIMQTLFVLLMMRFLGEFYIEKLRGFL